MAFDQVFNTNQAFKLMCFVWGDYDPKENKFVKSGFFGSILPLIWNRVFYCILLSYIIRYGLLAIIPPSHHGTLEFYFGDYASAVTGL